MKPPDVSVLRLKSGWEGRMSLFLPSPVLAKGRGAQLCKVSLRIKYMWTAGLPRVLQVMITSQWEQLSNSMEWLLIFSLSIHSFTSWICFMLTHSTLFLAHVCTKTVCVHTQTSKHKEKDRRKKQRQRPWMSSGYVMCISLEGRLKRRFCFPHQRPQRWGIPLFLSYSDSPPPLLPVSWINNKE